MKNKNVLQAIKFTLVSLSAGIIEISSDALFLYVFQREEWWAHYLPALTLSVLWNFTINRKNTFKPTNHIARDMTLVALYYVVFTPTSTALGTWLKEAKGMHDTLATLCMMILNFITEFPFQKFVVYREGKKR